MADFKMRTMRAAFTNTSTQDFTVSGFGTVKGALIWVTSAVSDDSLTAGTMLSFGFIDEADLNASITQWGQDAVATSNTGRSQSVTNCVATQTASGIEFTATGAKITDGIRLTWSGGNPSTAYLCTVVLFGGTDFECEISNNSSQNTANVEFTVTGETFRPQAFILLDIHATAMDASGIVDTNNSYGFLSATGLECKEAGMSMFADDAQSTTANAMNMHPGAIAQFIPGSLVAMLKTQQINADGWVMLPDNAMTNNRLLTFAMRINGGSIDTTTFLSPTSTGDFEVSYANEPEACLYMSTVGPNALRVGLHVGGVYGLGVSVTDSVGKDFSVSVANRDNVTTSECHSEVVEDVVQYTPDHAGVEQHRATHVAFRGNKHVVNVSNANASSKPFVGMSFSSGDPKKQPRLRRL